MRFGVQSIFQGVCNAMKIVLEVVGGHRVDIGKRLEMSSQGPENFVVGRLPNGETDVGDGSPEISLSASDHRISRRHFLILLRPPNCYVRDLGSTNGTYLETSGKSQAVTGTVPLHNGAILRAGQTTLRVLLSPGERKGHESEPCSGINDSIRSGQADEASPRKPVSLAKCEPSWSEKENGDADKPDKTYRCCRCGSDVSDRAGKDGRAIELEEVALYLCDTCARDERSCTKDVCEYEILECIGTGGMGSVYRARHKVSARCVALKELTPDRAMDRICLEIFHREITACSILLHPAIIRFYESFTDHRIPYLVTEYAPGGDADAMFLGERKPLSIERASEVVLPIVSALSFVHAQGLVHRDVKPSNIVFDLNGRARLCDMGLAKSFETAGQSGITGSGQGGGTMFFMAPEQISDFRYVRPPADVYSAGVCLYYFVTGKLPYDFPSPLELLLNVLGGDDLRHPLFVILEEDPIPIRQISQDIPPTVSQVIDKSIMRRPEDRFKDAGEMYRALAEALGKDHRQ